MVAWTALTRPSRIWPKISGDQLAYCSPSMISRSLRMLASPGPSCLAKDSSTIPIQRQRMRLASRAAETSREPAWEIGQADGLVEEQRPDEHACPNRRRQKETVDNSTRRSSVVVSNFLGRGARTNRGAKIFKFAVVQRASGGSGRCNRGHADQS